MGQCQQWESHCCLLLQGSAWIPRARSLSRIEQSRTRLLVGVRSLMCEKVWLPDRQTRDKVIPMCRYASQVTQKGLEQKQTCSRQYPIVSGICVLLAVARLTMLGRWYTKLKSSLASSATWPNSRSLGSSSVHMSNEDRSRIVLMVSGTVRATSPASIFWVSNMWSRWAMNVVALVI